MSLLDNLRERIASAIQPRRNQSPKKNGRNSRDVGSVSTGNELTASLRGTVFACLQHRANALSAITFESFLEKNYSLEELPKSHWTNELLRNPNPYFTRSQIFGYIENWLSINGNAFIWTPTNGYRVPLQMWVLNPTRMRVIRGTDNFIEGYVYQSAQDGNIPLPEKEVIHLARLHPASRPEEMIGMNIFGVGLVQAALDYANLDKDASNFLSRLFKNNAIPPLIAKYPERYDYDDWLKLKARWNEELPDYKLRALLAGGLELVLPPKSEISASYDGISNDTRSQIAQVFGVPPGMLTGEYQNRATAEVQWAIFRQNTIDPEALYIAEEFTRHFRRWENNILLQAQQFVFDDPAMALQNEEFELRWGIKTVNDSRRERGYDAIVEGDTPLIAGGYVPLDSLALLSPMPATERSISNEIVTQNVLNDDIETSNIKDYYWRQFDGLTEDNAAHLERLVSKSIKGLNKKLQSRFDSGNYNVNNIDLTDEEYARYRQSVAKACESVKKELGQELGFDPKKTPKQINDYINQVADESVQSLQESVVVIKKEVKQTLKNVSKEDAATIREVMSRKYKSLEESRAKTIAQTTSSNATSATQYTVFKENGIKMMWLSQRDGRVRYSHQLADGKFANSQGYFTVGGEKTTRPLGPGLSAGNSINCRCQLFPVRS